jgi:hypothetical protein
MYARPQQQQPNQRLVDPPATSIEIGMPPLLGSQGNHRVDSRRSPRRHERRALGDEQQPMRSTSARTRLITA